MAKDCLNVDAVMPTKSDIHQKMWAYIYAVNAPRSGRTALVDGSKSYTYAEMFRAWERYAAVFSYLGMTGAEKSRVGLSGSGSAESIISFYALNMVGAEVSFFSAFSEFKAEKLIQDIRNEHLTDLIMTDDYAADGVIDEILSKKEALGLRNVILLHVPVTGCTMPFPLEAAFAARYRRTKRKFAAYYMDTLLSKYEDTPVQYAPNESRELAVILHTTGTTEGTGKPIVLSDKALNALVTAFPIDQYPVFKDNLTCGVIVDLHTSYGMANQVHMPLVLGGTVAIIPGGFVNPLLYKAVSHYKISLLFSNAAMIEMWMKLPSDTKFDFSSLKAVAMGGTSISVKDKLRYHAFFQKYGGGDIPLVNGYGVSEMGGVCTLSSPDLNDESVGYPVPGVEIRLFDEESKIYHSVSDAPCAGVLYIRGESMTSGVLDGKQTVAFETIDGKPFVCTNDLMYADKTGKLTYLGRANRYFLHENGVKYQSGRVETEVARQKGIESCGIVPVMDKMSHDNLPMLCVKPEDGFTDKLEVVRTALYNVFVRDKILEPNNLPAFILLSEELPRNINGKLDLYRINRGQVRGKKYCVQGLKNGNMLDDIRFSLYNEDDDDLVKSGLKFVTKGSKAQDENDFTADLSDPEQITRLLATLFGIGTAG